MLGAYRIVIGLLVLILWGMSSVSALVAVGIGGQIPSDVLAFVSDRGGRRDIYIIDLEHGISFNMTRDRAYDDSPAWTADGKLSFESYRYGGSSIILMDIPANHSRTLTNSAGNYNPTWSANGQLAYITTRNANLEIML